MSAIKLKYLLCYQVHENNIGYSSCFPYNTLRSSQNGRHFPDDIFKCIFFNELLIPVTISLKSILNGLIDNIPLLVQTMAWHRPLYEPIMLSLVTPYALLGVIELTCTWFIGSWNLSYWVTHISVSKLTTIGSDNGLSPGRRQAIIWTNAGILLIWPLGTNFIEI